MARDPRTQGDEAKKIAALERQLLERLGADGGLHPRLRWVEDFRARAHHRDLLACASHRQRQVHAGGLRGFQAHFCSRGLKPGDLGE
jgi:hypothetical protein